MHFKKLVDMQLTQYSTVVSHSIRDDAFLSSRNE